MKKLNFTGYSSKLMSDINLKIVKELLKLEQDEEIEIEFEDGSMRFKKTFNSKNEKTKEMS